MEVKEVSNETADYQRKLIKAVKEGDVLKLKEICASLPKGFNMNFKCSTYKSESLVHLAHTVEILKTLIENGANIHLKSHKDRTALHLSCISGNLDILKYLLQNVKEDSFINAVTVDGQTAVHLACSRRNAEMLNLLHEYGANIYMKTKDNKNALHLACINRNEEIVKYLLKNVPESSFIHAETSNGENLFSVACLYLRGQDRETLIRLLLGHGFSVNSIGRCGTTVLINAVTMNDYSLAEILCRHGANVNLGTYNSYKAIHLLCEKHNNPEMVQLLINHGANINENWRHGQRPIHLALKHSRTQNVEVLLDAGADISGCIRLNNVRYSYISTLCLAALKCPNLVPKFLKRGANPNEVHSTSGLSVLELVLEHGGDKETVKSVIQAGASITKSCRGKNTVQCCKNLAQIFAFLESGVTVSEIERQLNKSLIAMAIENDYCGETVCENISKLISLGANPNGTATLKDSALIISMKDRFWKIVDILIAQGADVNHKGENGNTALHVCCQNASYSKSYKDMIGQLCSVGADVNVMNNEGLTPLLILLRGTSRTGFFMSNSRNADTTLIRCLLNHGANMDAVFPTTSESTLRYACAQGDIEIAKILIEAGYNVNKCEKNGEVPIFACFPLESTKKTKILHMLLEHGASANVLDREGISILDHVFQKLLLTQMNNYSSFFLFQMERRNELLQELTSILLQLLLNKANPNLATPGQDSLLLQAIQTPGMDDVVSALVEAGADVCHIGRNQITSFEACCLNDAIGNISERQLNVLTCLIGANFPLNEPLRNGRYPLEFILDYGNTDIIIQDMLSKGADPNKYKEGNEPPLILSLDRSPSVTHALMKAGADTSVKNKENISALELFYEKVFYEESYCCLPENPKSAQIIIEHFEWAERKMDEEEQNKNSFKASTYDFLEGVDKGEISKKKRSGKMVKHQQKCNPSLLMSRFRKHHKCRINTGESRICSDIIKMLVDQNNDEVNSKMSSGLYPLCVAVKLGDNSLLDFFLKKKANPNCMDQMDVTPLCFALIHGDEDMVNSLIKAGANVNHCGVLPVSRDTGKKESLLNRLLEEHGCFSYGNNLVRLVQILIENGASVNECEEGSASPLIKAVRLLSFELVDLLLREGANVNHHGKKGFTALHEIFSKCQNFQRNYDAENANTEIFQLLLDSGASVNSQTESGDTPVHIGIKNVCFKFVLAMLSKAFHPNTQNNKGTTCLMLVVTNYDLFKQLLDIGTDPTIQDHEGNTVLHHLCSTSFETKKEKEMIELLVKSGSTVNGLNLEGYTPLNRMIAEKKKLIVEDVVYLLSLKADPNICLEGCHSPLMNSLLRWNLDVAYYLLNAGGDVKHDGKSGLTALHVILNLQLPHAERPMKYLCYIDSNKEQDGYAAERIDMIQKLLEAGSDVNKRDCEGNTGLNFCLKTLYKGGKDEFIPVVRILLKAGADPNISDISGKRPLEIVISTSPRKYRNETEIRKLAEMLIIYGAKFNDYKKGEDSVLHLAVSKELKSVVYLLVTKGADVNHQGKYQQTPLHRYFSLANEYKPADVPVLQRMNEEELKSPEIVDILLSSTKDPNIEDENKDSPLNLACACSSKNENDLSKLLKAGANPLHKGKENVDAFEKCIALENFPALEILLKEKGSNHITDLHFSAFWNVFHIYDDELYERVAFLMLKTNENININKENLTGNTPLTYFCHRNGTEVVRKLLEKGANVNVITTTGLNALHSLLDSPDVAPKLDTISVVLASNPNTEVKDSSGKTVLQRAIHKYQKCYYTNTSSFTNKCLATLMGHLLNSGAKCEKSELTSLLLIASERQQYLLMKELVKRGADLSVKKWERGILHNCWNNHFISEDNLPKLLAECIVYLKFHQEFGGSLTEVFDDCTPLLSYLKSDSFKKSNKCKERSDEVVALLACDKEIVCKYDRRLLSAIHIAASSGRLSAMKILVEKGANLFSKGREENSCLHFCLSSEENSIEDMVSYLLENGISANDMNLSNETPLYLILKNAKYHSEDEVSSIVKLLIKYGGNPNPGNVEKNPFVKAIRTLNVRSVLILLKNGAKVNCLQDGTSALHIMYDQSQSALFQDKCYEEKISCLQQLLLTKQLDINAKNTYEETVLHLAVKALCNRRTPNGAIRLIQELVEHGVDINATNKIGQTAFSLSCDFLSYDNECFAVSKYLLENGSNPNKGSPLNCLFKQWHYEGNYRLKELILQLLSYGANPNDGIFKPTCLPNLIIAINKGELRIVNTLLERGANPNVSDFNGTSLFHACKLGSENAKKVMPLLLQYGCSINGGQQREPHSSYRRHPLFKLVEKITEDHEYVEIERKGKEMIAKVDLRLFNLLLCGGCDLSFPLRSGCKGNSILASLTKAGYFKAAETLIRCGYNFKDDEIFGKISLTNLDVTTVRTKQRRYRRANYEKAVEEFQEMLTRNQEHATLFSLSRKAIREHLVFVHNGSDIEILIKLLPLPEKIKKYLTYREYTQDFEEIKLQEETRSEDTNTNIRYTGPGVDSSLYDYQYDDFVVDDYRDDSDDSPLSYYDDFDDYMYDTDTFDFI